MIEAAKFRPLYGRVLQWFYGHEHKPNASERRVYELAEHFHGFRAEGLNPELFDATFLAVFVRAYLKPPKPVFFFVPKVHSEWALGRLRVLAHEAVALRPTSEIAVRATLKRMTIAVPPWALEAEPADWVAYGFSEKDLVILPEWCNSKLI